MILWPLSKKHLTTLQDAFTSKFGDTHILELINDRNAGFIAYSEMDDKNPKTVLNTAEPVILSLIIDEYLKPFVEHEHLHIYGKGNHKVSSLNPPEATPDNLWQVAQSTLTTQIIDIIKCSNVIFQQELAKDYVKFECKKFAYLHEKYGRGILRASQLMTYGYLDAFSDHLRIDAKTWMMTVQSTHFDIYDKAIVESTRELIAEFLTLRKDNQDVDLFHQCVNLDQKIRHQKNIL